MKRLHIHVGVEKLADSISFYSAMFGAEPIKVKDDYAKWMLDDPCVNFAISTRAKRGVDHLGVQVEAQDELTDLRQRLTKADLSMFDEGETACCYAKSDKSWVRDPSGIAWEAYQNMADVQYFGQEPDLGEACCAPADPVETKAAAADKKATGCCG